MENTKVLLGKMDKENSPESIHPYDHIDAHNIRNTGSEKSEANYTTNLEGTRLITSLTPVGQNTAAGGAKFESIGKAYYVRYNSMGYHQIVEFDYASETESIIFENLTDSNNVDIFPVTPESFFCDVRLLDNRYLILNDGVNSILNIDINRFKTNKTRKFTADDLLLAKKPSLIPPTIEYLSDIDRSSNGLRGNLFQFRYQNVYSNNEKSSFSTVSKRTVPTEEPANGQGQLVNSLNVLKVSVVVNNFENLSKLNIAFRSGLNNWLLVKEIDVSYIKNLPNTTITIGTNTESYDPVTRTYSFLFYNDGTYPVLDQIEVNNPYDAIPTKAETVEVINGNLVTVGGITEGYDRPEVDGVKINVTYYEDNIQTSSTDNTNPFRVSGIEPNLGNHNFWIVNLSGAPKAGDVVILKLKPNTSIVPVVSQYTVTSTDEANGLIYTKGNVISSLNSQVPSGVRVLSYGTIGGLVVDTYPNHQYTLDSMYIRLKDIGSLSTQSFNTVKTNAGYQLALFYIDQLGKYFPVVTDDRFIIRTDSLAKTEGLLPQINWTLPEEAPRGAVSYQWGISENQTFQNYITLVGKYETSGSDSEYLTLNLTSLARFYNNEKESSVTYSFTKGDKVTFIKMLDGSGNTVKWFKYPFIELDIIDYKIEVNPDDATDVKYLLKVRNTSLLDVTEIQGKDLILELFTPKGRSVDANSEIFYEIGEQYPIINGKHSKTFGVIKEADAYYRGRLYASAITENASRVIKVEDRNFSDNYESKYWSAGRARTYFDEVGRVEYPASIRYSSEYIRGSRTFGFNTFYLERIYGEQGGQTTSKYGWIRKLEARNDGVVCIQERKVSIIPNYKTIVYDNAANNLIADSGKIFGSAQPRIGNYGCGIAKESITVSRDSVIYFIDSNNCVPIRDSFSGLDKIDVLMSHYFVEHIQNAISRGSKLIGYFDDFYGEYNVTTQDKRGVLAKLSFKDSKYKDSYPIDYSQVQNLTVSHGAINLDTTTGEVTYTPSLDYVGTDTISFDYFGKHIVENVNVQAGDKVPDPIVFTPKVNQLKNTLVTSDTITLTGINTPIGMFVVDGEMSKNGGTWSTFPVVGNNGDTFRVRRSSASTPSTTVKVTLNAGGYLSDFNITTAASDVDGTLLITHSITAPDPQTGDKNRYGVKIELSHKILVPYSSKSTLVYKRFGSNTIKDTGLVTIPIGDLSVETPYIITDADPTDAPVTGTVYSTTINNGDIVACEDGVNRIASINLEFTNS